MSSSFRISTDRVNGALTMALAGELDLSGVAAFNDALAAIDSTVTSVLIDLAALTFVDSSGVGCFSGRVRQGSRRGGPCAARAGSTHPKGAGRDRPR